MKPYTLCTVANYMFRKRRLYNNLTFTSKICGEFDALSNLSANEIKI